MQKSAPDSKCDEPDGQCFTCPDPMQDPVNMLAPSAGVIPVTLVVFGIIVAVPIYFIVRFLRAYERPSRADPSDQASAMKIAALQEELEVLRAEVVRLTDAQDFTTQLLHERPIRELKSVGKDESAHHELKPKR